MTKITHNLTDRQSLNFSYTFRKLPSVKGGFPRFPEPFVAQGVWDQLFKSYYARLQHDWTCDADNSSTTSTPASRALTSRTETSRAACPASDSRLESDATQNLGLPLVGFPGYGDPVNSTDPRAYQAGGSTFFDNRVRDNSVHLSDVATLIRGRHTLKFGGEVRIQQLNNAAHFDIGGNFNFRSNQTGNTNTTSTRAGPSPASSPAGRSSRLTATRRLIRRCGSSPMPSLSRTTSRSRRN